MNSSRSFENYPKVMTSDEVGELLGHPAPVILMWVHEGRFPAYKEPGSQRWWFDRDTVIDWIRQHPVVQED